MKNLDITFGRLGNRLFQTAFLYAESHRRGIDFYFQDPKYFAGYEDEIKQLFGENIGYLTQVGIHVRRGANPINPDEPKYSENPFYTNPSETDYYERAMALFPGDKFLVFSDDVSWCKEKWKDNPNVQVMEQGNEIDDFNLLASCKDLIIANSSFSWWAAYLCPNHTKKIICPRQWYADEQTQTVLPEEWIKI